MYSIFLSKTFPFRRIIKDSTDFLNKIEQLNQKGPVPSGTLLVSWDVVSMLPNIDNNLDIKAVEKALNSRDTNFPSIECRR